MHPWKFLLRKVPGLPGSGMPPKLSCDEQFRNAFVSDVYSRMDHFAGDCPDMFLCK